MDSDMYANGKCKHGVLYAVGCKMCEEEYEATRKLPKPVPAFCCGARIKPCAKCGADVWKSFGDYDGYWSEESFRCTHCGNKINIALPD